VIAERVPFVIVGAGIAGLSAAIEAARVGVSVTVVDEADAPGGQIYRQLPSAFRVADERPLGKDFRHGRELLAQLEGLPIRFVGGATVWGCFEERVLEVATDDRAWRLAAEVIVVASGAYDRPVPVPGWTLPGVLTVGGAQTLLKSQRVLPGRRMLLAGTGPLLLVVASQMAKHGVDVVAVADPVPTRDVLRRAGALLRGWRISRDGIGYRWTLVRAGVPWISPAILTRIEGDGIVESATVARVDQDWRPIPGTERTFQVDTVCMGYGLIPSIELLRLMNCAIRYDPLADAWVPERDDEFQTSVARVFAVGDGAGVAGAVVAADEGRVAGLAAARLLGQLTADGGRDRMRAPRQRLAQLASFRTAIDETYRLKPGLYELADQGTIVCRCEEVRVRDLTAAFDDGASTMSVLKAWTRSGMGACQARMCGIATAHSLARRVGQAVESVGAYSPRPPVKPVSIEALIDELRETDAGSIGGQGAGT
jgi:NADPH-dependent 2,4-dienoyl-CoA reductase/sulfur reductase-like enzyme